VVGLAAVAGMAVDDELLEEAWLADLVTWWPGDHWPRQLVRLSPPASRR